MGIGVPPTTTADAPPPTSPRRARRPSRHAATRYNTRQAYDAAEATYRRLQGEDPWASPSPGGGLAWSESRALQSYLTMYRATRDVTYLDRLVACSQPVLAARDTQRGTTDYRGQSLPGWGAADPYTVSSIDLDDDEGQAALRLVTAAPGRHLLVDVRTAADGLFDLDVRSSTARVELVRGLSLDPRHPRHVVRVLDQQFPGPAALTASDLSGLARPPTMLAAARGLQLRAQRYVFAVHTGMICAPFAEFAALLVREPGLRRRYGQPAAEMLSAAEAAVALHDDDWRPLGTNTGLYAFPIGSPVPADGTYLPHNQYLAMARCLAHLYLATANPDYGRRVTLMLNLFRSELGHEPSPIWPYYWSGSQSFRGFDAGRTTSSHSPRMGPQQMMEDPGHGALDVEALVAGLDAGSGVPVALMSRLGGTFVNRVVRKGSDGRWVTVTALGSARTSTPESLAAVRWIELARWDRRVYPIIASMLDGWRPVLGEGSLLAPIARLVELH